MTSGEIAHMSAFEHRRDLLRTAERERRLTRTAPLFSRR